MAQPTHAAVAAIAVLSDAQLAQVLYQLVVWLIDAARIDVPVEPQFVLAEVVRLAGQHRGGRWQSP